jgi:hypothetical protein
MPEPLTRGESLKRAVLSAAAAEGIYSLAELARVAHVNKDTMGKWFAEASTPTDETFALVASAISRPVSYLWDAWEGRQKPSGDAIREAVAVGVAEGLERFLGRPGAAEAVRRARPRQPPPPSR